MTTRPRALRIAVATASVVLAIMAIPLFSTPVNAASSDSSSAAPAVINPAIPPLFTECPAVGHNTGCGIQITLNANGTATIASDSNQGPYDGNDDTLVGVVNNTGVPIPSIVLTSSNDIFGFDGDGICTYTFTGDGYCGAAGSPGYQGPDNTYGNISSNKETGTVDFTSALATGTSTYFSLESNLSGASFTIPADFVLNKTVTTNPPYYAGNTSTPITYNVSAHNIGDTTGNVTITDTVPTNTTLVSGSQACTSIPSGATCTPTASGNNLTWTVTNVAGGGSVTVGFSVDPNASSSNYVVSNTGAWSGPGCSASSCPTNTTTTNVTAPLSVTVTADPTTSTYGTPPSSVGYMLSGDTDGPPATSPTCSTTVTATTVPGTYANANSCTGAADPRYTFTYVKGTATVDKAPLTVTASGGSMNYGGTPPTITPGFTGLKNGDDPTSDTTCSTTALKTSPVGTYPSSCSVSASWAQFADYAITYVPGSVVVTPAPLTITASSGSMTYGGTVPVITAGYTGLENGDLAPTVTPTCSTTATTSSSVSGNPYSSSCTGASDPNYTISYVAGTVTVDPAPLTITASSPTVIVGDTIPTITPSYTGLVNGDTAPSPTSPTCSTTATSSSPTGTYTTSCSGAVDANYTITYVNGSLTITPGFTVVKSVSPSSGVVAGSTTPIVYTLVATNSGKATTGSAVTITDGVPAGTTLVSGSPACAKGGPPACTVSVSGSTITWTIPSGVAPGGSYTLTFSVTANAGDATGTTTNTAIWSGPGCVTTTSSAPTPDAVAQATTVPMCNTNTASTTVTAAPATAPATTPTTTTPTTTTPTTAAPAAAPSTSPAIAFTGALLVQEWIAGGAAVVLGLGLLFLARWRRRTPRHAAGK